MDVHTRGKNLQAGKTVTSMWGLRWDRTQTVTTDFEQIEWKTGSDSVFANVLGVEQASRLRQRISGFLPAIGICTHASNILTLAALFDPLGGDGVSWRPFGLALAGLLLTLPIRILLIGESAVPILKLLIFNFDWILPAGLVSTSFLALADCMRWEGRAWCLLSIVLSMFTVLHMDATPDHGRSALAIISMNIGGAIALATFVGVSAGAVQGLYYRPIFDFGTTMPSGDISAVRVTNLELFRACQSMLLTLLVRTSVSRIRSPQDCIILKTGCIIREVQEEEGEGVVVVESDKQQVKDSTPAITVALPSSTPPFEGQQDQAEGRAGQDSEKDSDQVQGEGLTHAVAHEEVQVMPGGDTTGMDDAKHAKVQQMATACAAAAGAGAAALGMLPLALV